MNAMLPAHLSETLNNLGEAAHALTEETRASTAAQKRQNRLMTTGLAIVAVLVVGLLTIVLQNRSRSNENAEILRQTATTSARIADCTTVGGTCYQQGGERAAEAVRMIIRAQIYLPACKQASDTDAEAEQCVMRRLLESTAAPAPSPSPAASPRSPAPSSPAD